MRTETYRVNHQMELVHWWYRARRSILLELLLNAVPPSTDTLLLDIGCGSGGNAAAFSKHYSVVGVDPSPMAIEFATSAYPGTKFFKGAATHALATLGLEPKCIVLADVLEHVADDFEVFSSLVSSTRPGTVFLVTVPADNRLWSRHDEANWHYRRYDLDRLQMLWAGLPVSCSLVSYFNSRLYTIVRAVRAINSWRGQSYGVADTDLRIPSPLINWCLEKVFAGERRRLAQVLHGVSRPFGRGVSLVALLRRECGTVVPRTKPKHLVDKRGPQEPWPC